MFKFRFVFIPLLIIITSCPVLVYRSMQKYEKTDLMTAKTKYFPNIRLGTDNRIHILTNYLISGDGYYVQYLQSDTALFEPPSPKQIDYLNEGTGTIFFNWLELDTQNNPGFFISNSIGGLFYKKGENGTPTNIINIALNYFQGVMTQDNKLLAAYSNASVISYHISTNWVTANPLCNRDINPASLSIDVDSFDTLYSSFIDLTSDLCFSSVQAGGSGSPVTPIDIMAQGSPTSIKFTDGRVNIVYSLMDSTFSKNQIQMIRFNPGNPSISNPVLIDESDNINVHYIPSQLVSDRFGTLYLAYYQVEKEIGIKADWQLKAAVITKSEPGPVKPILVDQGESGDTAFDGLRPAIDVDSKGNIFIVYQYINNTSDYEGILRMADTRMRQ